MNDIDRLPPHDEAAELSILGSVLLAFDKCFPAVATLAVDEFFLPHHREAWAAILAVVARRMPVDLISVGDELTARGTAPRFPGGWQAWAVGAASTVAAPEHIDSHAGIVRDKATLRKMIALCAEVQALAYSSQQAGDVMACAREGVAALELRSGDKDSIRLGDALGGVLDVIEERTAGTRSPGVSYGLDALDAILGAAKPGQLILVAARPGEGKSALVEQIAVGAALAGHPAHLFSLEMLIQELAERALSGPSRVPSYQMANGKLTHDDWKAIQKAGGKLADAPLWVDDQSRTLTQILAKTRKWHAIEARKEGVPLGIMAVDYIQRIAIDSRKGETRDLEIGRVGRELKSLAMELQIPVIAVAALSRAVERRGGRPMLGDLRECGSLEYEADVVIFIYRDIPPEDQKARRLPGPGELGVSKHRGGPTGVADVYWNSPLMAWQPLEKNYEDPGLPPPRPSWNTKDDF